MTIFAGNLSSLQVLLIEPHPHLAPALEQAFQEEGFHIDRVRQWKEAESRIVRKAYDLIVLDLPWRAEMNVSQNREDHHLRTPLLILANPQLDSVPDSHPQSLSIARLVKPFSLDELFCQVRQLIEQHRLGQ